MKLRRLWAAALSLALLLTTACTAPQEIDIDNSAIDFAQSVYKHITNGGITDDPDLPYNVDAITGATLTVEGPGVVTSIPLSVRELENRNDGLFRGIYEDSTGRFIYEGADLYYMLHDMTDGDNGIFLTDTAYKVQLKDSNRALVADVGGRFYRWPASGALYAADGVHPSELGSHIAAETIVDVIRHYKEAE